MSMTWEEAKAWAETERKILRTLTAQEREKRDRDWRDGWKWGQVVRGVGLGSNGLIFDWGPEATTKQKNLLKECIYNPSKWAEKVENILEDPPTADERKLFKKMKKMKLI